MYETGVSLLMPQSQDVNPNVAFQGAWGRMGKHRMSKYDTRKVLRNKHTGLIELVGLHSSLWLCNRKHQRQMRILITGGARCLSFVKEAQYNVSSLYYKAESADNAFSVSLLFKHFFCLRWHHFHVLASLTVFLRKFTLRFMRCLSFSWD